MRTPGRQHWIREHLSLWVVIGTALFWLGLLVLVL